MTGQAQTMTSDSPQEGFQVLLERHRKIVFKVANMYCRNPEDRRDLAQEICTQLWRSFPGFDASRPFSTWMYRIALNVGISFARQEGHRKQHSVAIDDSAIDAIDESAALSEPDERVRALHRFIDQLDVLNRALMLLYLEDRSYREIAEVLGISETNVATKINRLKQRIRTGIAETEQ